MRIRLLRHRQPLAGFRVQALRPLINDIRLRLPEAEGRPIVLRLLPDLHAHRGRLTSEPPGLPVYGASHIRKREIVLDLALAAAPDELRRILIHELFHFAWVRLSNAARSGYGQLVASEFEGGARGELGWASDSRKRALLTGGCAGGKPWREYLCESFCDSGAWLYAGLKAHPEFTLAQKHRRRRAAWFAGYLSGRMLSI